MKKEDFFRPSNYYIHPHYLRIKLFAFACNSVKYQKILIGSCDAIVNKYIDTSTGGNEKFPGFDVLTRHTSRMKLAVFIPSWMMYAVMNFCTTNSSLEFHSFTYRQITHPHRTSHIAHIWYMPSKPKKEERMNPSDTDHNNSDRNVPSSTSNTDSHGAMIPTKTKAVCHEPNSALSLHVLYMQSVSHLITLTLYRYTHSTCCTFHFWFLFCLLAVSTGTILPLLFWSNTTLEGESTEKSSTGRPCMYDDEW